MKVDVFLIFDDLLRHLLYHRLVEEADYKSTAELFAKKGDEKTLDNFIPKSESDFLEYAELISHKLRPYEVSLIIFLFLSWFCINEVLKLPRYILLMQKSFHYIALLKAVIRLSVTSLKAADTKDIASSITAIANEKLKVEKETTSKKKTGNTYVALFPIFVFHIVYLVKIETKNTWWFTISPN